MSTIKTVAILSLAGLSLAGAAMALGGCGGGPGISTASVLDGAPNGVTGAASPIKNNDPNARTVQVAWTSARATRCGFIFDPAKLKANFLASEAARTGPSAAGANTEKVYDQTVTTISARVKADPDYCSPTKSTGIKADLQRHLAGNYDPNLPVEKKQVASGGLFDGMVSDEPAEPFTTKKFWEDIEAKKQGAKGAQQ